MSEWLSEAGRQKRAEILVLALRAARKRRRGRSLMRAAGRSSALLVLIALIVVATRWSALSRRPIPVATREPNATTTRAIRGSQVVIAFVPTDSTITDRLATAPEAPRWQTINDEDLIRSLRDEGQSAGLIRIGRHTTLLTSATPTE